VTWSGGVGSVPIPNTSVNTGESGTACMLGTTGASGALCVWHRSAGTDISSTVLTNPPGDPSAVAQWDDKVNAWFGPRPARLHRRSLALLRHRGLWWEYDTSSLVSSGRSPDSPNSQGAAPPAEHKSKKPGERQRDEEVLATVEPGDKQRSNDHAGRAVHHG
jgi:hypothetical protein